MGGYNCKIGGKKNTWADLLSRIPRQLAAQPVRLEPGVDDRAYQIHVINSHGLRDQSRWEDKDKEPEVITNPHWKGVVEESQTDSGIAALRAKVEKGITPKYVLQDGLLYYLSGRNEEVRLWLFVPKLLRGEILRQCHEILEYTRPMH